MRDEYISNKGGKRINPAEEFRLPEVASGQTKTMAAGSTNYTLTVVADERYWIQNTGSGVMFLGIADSTSAANVLWTIPVNAQIGIEIPVGYTTLHFSTNNAGDIMYLSKART